MELGYRILRRETRQPTGLQAIELGDLMRCQKILVGSNIRKRTKEFMCDSDETLIRSINES